MIPLPDNWELTNIGNLCSLVNGRAFKPSDWTNNGLPIVRIQNLNNDNAQYNFYNGEVRERFLLKGGELLFAWSGTPGTSFGAHVWRGKDAVLNQHIFRVDFDETSIDKRFFRYAINQKLNELINIAHGGVGLRHVTKGVFENTKIVVPPLNEQKRIADKLDALLVRVDASRAHLERVQEILKDFRQSVLAAAVSGRLTEEWREENNSECVFLQSPQMTEYNDSLLPDLPNSWEWQRFGNVATIESNLVDPQKYQNYPHIAPNYIESQTGRLLAYGTVASDNIISANHLFRPGQIIYSKIRPYLCKAVIVNFSGLCSADMYPISGKLVSSEYLHKWLISQQFTLFASSKQGRTVLPKINQKALNEIPVPIPPAKEQQEIVRRVEVLFDYADRLETQTQAALDRVDNLTPSLLAKAFRGELVEQDPNDEPASVLLARIRMEREAVQPKKKK